ncbi:helix-turn-helix domain-containing protein [Alkalimonas collagenimarina]|uniref:Helix-turn-helix domain-containing protein n=1 Tax=Alkalimonas collagenimarina TaxID=400390 RepID=A0ABT9GUU1_9GAMM|nr:helix-turn-helix domain-containing protein [Alkalimonas collagenimarina]MDP4534743.1 helix-turn-helix domain-containing protein [Alkalimonas collagenimarina]
MNQPLSQNGDQLSEYQQKFGSLQENCPVRAALDIIRGRWKPSILHELKEETRRYSELQRALPGISPQALTTQLKQLEADGLIERDVYAEVPVRVEYRLSEFGETLSEVMDGLEQWGMAYLAHREKNL